MQNTGNKTKPERGLTLHEELKQMQHTRNKSEPELMLQRNNNWQTTQHIESSALNEQRLQERQNCSKKGKYWKQDCIEATIRKTKKRAESEKHCKNYNIRKTKKISAIYATDKDADLRCGQTSKRRPVQYTARQMYWIKRRRKLSHKRKEQN